MARNYVYSFEDTTVEIVHPGFGRYAAFGNGIGKVNLSYASNLSEQDIALDLSVVISKHAYKHGTVTFTVWQSTDFNAWLDRLVSFLKTANSDQWALTTISIKNRSTGDSYFISGVAPQKIPDKGFDAKAESRDWVFEAADISTN